MFRAVVFLAVLFKLASVPIKAEFAVFLLIPWVKLYLTPKLSQLLIELYEEEEDFIILVFVLPPWLLLLSSFSMLQIDLFQVSSCLVSSNRRHNRIKCSTFTWLV